MTLLFFASNNQFLPGQTTAPQPTTRGDPPRELAEVLHAQLVGGMAKFDSTITGSARLKDADDRSVLSVTRDSGDTITSLDLQIVHSGAGGEIIDSLSHVETRTSFSRVEIRAGGFSRSLTVSQINVPVGMRMARLQPRLTLRVYEDSSQGGRSLVSTIRADSFDDLIHFNIEEAEQYIRPMLRDLQIEDLMGPADVDALQVFAREAPIDPTAVAQVKTLVQRLDADSSDDRDAAAKKLKSLGGLAVVVLLKLDRAALSPEQSARIDAICGSAKPISPDQAQILRKSLAFLLGCMASENPALRAAAIKALQETTGKPVNFNNNADAWERSSQLEKVRQDLMPRPAE